MEIKLISEVPAIIEMNFEEVRTQLEAKLETYKSVEVTDENLKECKFDTKLLAGLKKSIDTFRKDKKKEMLIPIALFESKCNELISIVESVEVPIREGIKVFDDKKRQQNIDFARSEIERISQELGIEAKYIEQFSWSSSYENMSISKKDITKDVESKCENLLLLQEKEKIQEEAKKLEIERLEKERAEREAIIIAQQLQLAIVKKEQEEKDRIQRLELEAIRKQQREKSIEDAKVKQAFEDLRREKEEKEKEEARKLEEIKKDKQNKKITYTLELTGSVRALTELKAFMTQNDIQYNVLTR